MAKDIETNLSKKLSQMLDKRVTAEVKKIKTDVQKEIDDVKIDFREDVKGLQSQLDEICKKASSNRDSGRDMNVIIRNLPENVGENLETKVQGLIKDGMKLREVGFSRVVRKESRQRGKPGVVVMTCRSSEEKQTLMRNKRQLKDSRKHHDVYIHNDQAPDARLQADNFKTLLSSIGHQVPGLRLQGSRLVMERPGDRTFRNGGSRDRGYERHQGARVRDDPDKGRNSNRQQNRAERGDIGARSPGNDRRRT